MQAKFGGRRQEITHVVRHQCLRLSIDGGLKDHLIAGIGQLRPPLKANLNRTAGAGKGCKKPVYLNKIETMGQPLFGPLQHILVLQKKRWRYQGHKLARGDKSKDCVAGASGTPQRRHQN